MFRPITGSMEERRKMIDYFSKEVVSEELEKCVSLEDFYNLSRKIENGVLGKIQLYILDNFEKVPVEVWNNSTFSIVPHVGKERVYFGKKDKFTSGWTKHAESLRKIAKKRYDKSIKITSINFVLDWHDGDFSVTFNEGDWSFLWGDDIMDYYYVIKNYLNEKV